MGGGQNDDIIKNMYLIIIERKEKRRIKMLSYRRYRIQVDAYCRVLYVYEGANRTYRFAEVDPCLTTMCYTQLT